MAMECSREGAFISFHCAHIVTGMDMCASYEANFGRTNDIVAAAAIGILTFSISSCNFIQTKNGVKTISCASAEVCAPGATRLSATPPKCSEMEVETHTHTLLERKCSELDIGGATIMRFKLTLVLE